MSRLVLVEDHPILRETTANLLRDAFAGVELHSFADAESALAFCTSHSVDVVISDISLPGMSGMSLLELLSRQQPDVPVIIETLYDLPEHRQLAQLLRAFCLIGKNDIGSKLVPAVQAALQQRSTPPCHGQS